jgi:hypothetical protein
MSKKCSFLDKMKPGPKPTVEREALQTEASNWACVLFILREGRVALLTAVQWGNETTVDGSAAVQLSPEIKKQIAGTPLENAEMLSTGRKTRTGKTLGAQTYNYEEFEKMRNELPPRNDPGQPLVWYPPTQAAQDVWMNLKQSKSRRQMKDALGSFERWLNATPAISGWRGRPFPRNLSQYSDGLLDAKSLHNYPKAEKRPSSDDKRVLFFAKVLAGLRFGLSASYSTKKLSRWTFSRDAAVNPYKKFVQQIGVQKWKTKK